ncbi:AbrB/MazE/SpoVT family DNA-binding domain-containing protein [Halovivax limisalsi]|uniref:AbrB/MazE/SpoVT family DNA-binding domain-containing protein n=1 Tax=Halovivax limisalsi TaxID=1453760 RepID=UPI001FFC9F5D|nr:AbrB/MazE/SpoVT family DNA-binding domain-containing protein [Halovivax limisalsi]
MAKVDSKGRVVLPQEVRERLGMTPGTEVAIHEEGGKAVVEPEDDPEAIIDRMDQLVSEATANRSEPAQIDETADPVAQKHRAAIRRGAANDDDE